MAEDEWRTLLHLHVSAPRWMLLLAVVAVLIAVVLLVG